MLSSRCLCSCCMWYQDASSHDRLHRHGWKRSKERMRSPLSSYCYLLLTPFPLSLFTKYPSTHLQYGFKPFSPSSRILPKAFHTSFFNLGPHFLPTATQGRDPCFLLKLGPLVAGFTSTIVRLVDHSFSHTDHVGPCKVGAAHGNASVRRVDI